MAKGTKAQFALQHHNSKLNQEIADKVVEGVLSNKSLEKIADETGLCKEAAFKYIKGVKVPKDYPSNYDEWQSDVIGFLEIAIWKGTRRLADNGMELIEDKSVPISMAIAVDKLSLLRGQPTNITANMSISVNHRELLNELRNKPTSSNTSDAVDV
jgi:hypothetical protein